MERPQRDATKPVDPVTAHLQASHVLTRRGGAARHIASFSVTDATHCADLLRGMDVALVLARARSPYNPFKDVVAMPLNRSPMLSNLKLNRPAGPHCRGGASSLLRLSQPATPRLPTPLDLADWMSRAAAAFGRSAAMASR